MIVFRAKENVDFQPVGGGPVTALVQASIDFLVLLECQGPGGEADKNAHGDPPRSVATALTDHTSSVHGYPTVFAA
jgi:hypothetical protein